MHFAYSDEIDSLIVKSLTVYVMLTRTVVPLAGEEPHQLAFVSFLKEKLERENNQDCSAATAYGNHKPAR